MIGGSLSLCGVEVRRSGRKILRLDNLRISSGAFVGVIGSNGAGKTTLLKVCCGLIKPNRGTIKLEGTDLTALNAWAKANLRKRIGYIPQIPHYNPDLPFTLREVVAMGRISIKPLLTRLNSEDYNIVDGWIERFGLSGHSYQTFRSLSGGEQQKTLIARAMAQEPQILMLDEPCANLDFNWKYQITEIISQLHRKTGITILIVSHETNLLPTGCNRVLLLHEGGLLADGDVEEVLVSEALETAYQCQIETLDIGGRKYAFNKDQMLESQ